MGAEARRRFLAIGAAALVLALIVSLSAGCGQQTDPRVQKLLKDANARMSKAAEVAKSVEAFNREWEALVAGQVNAETSARLEDLFSKTKASETASLDETKAARDDYAKAAGLPVSSAMKKYIDLRRQALDQQEQFLSLELKAMDLRIKVVKGEAAGDPLQTLIELDKQIENLEQESAAHAKRAAALHKEASDYYGEQKLGG
jgi:uncharacterized lipoprotein YehR (DUF1307 family)